MSELLDPRLIVQTANTDIQASKLKQLGTDLRLVGEALRYAARNNCCRNPKEREALKRIMEFAKVSQQ